MMFDEKKEEGADRGSFQREEFYPGSFRVGFLLVDSSMNLVYINDEAVQILSFPHALLETAAQEEYISQKIRLFLPEDQSTPPKDILLGRRQYKSRILTVVSHSQDCDGDATAILLERNSVRSTDFVCPSVQYGLSPRELDTVGHLLQGYTNKEIARRMDISPYTVKAYLRLIMVKMSASTRSGIVGKLVRVPDDDH